MPWAFYMKYNRKHKSLTLDLSKHMSHKLHMPMGEMTLNHQEIKHFIHKYDYRKLDYFSIMPIEGPFDTTLRFKDLDQKTYMRTHAVCQKDPSGFHCILFDDKDVHDMTLFYKQIKDIEPIQIELAEGELQRTFESKQQIKIFQDHLAHIAKRDAN